MEDRNGRYLGLLLVAAATLGGCGRTAVGPPPGTPPGAPGTVVILVFSGTAAGDDAAHAAQQGLAGEPDTVVFERHYAASPDTEPAIASLISGFPGPLSAADSASPATEDAASAAEPRPVLAELFSRIGYATFAVVTDERLAPQLGFARGFEHYEFHPGMSPAEQRELVRRQVEDVRGPLLGFVQVDRPDRAAVEEWLGLLRGLDRFDGTLLLVTSDHGMTGGSPDSVEARFRDAVVRIPCIVKFPRGGRPETVAPRTTSLTSAVDLLPSLLALVGRDISDALPGSNVFDGYFTGHALVETADAWAFVQDHHKLIVGPDRRILFDLAEDPQEQRDVAADLPERAEALLASAVEARAAVSAGPEEGLQTEEGVDEETLEHLRSLGYIQ